MADLGLSQLPDEQLLDLLNETVTELLGRDPVVRRVAQSGVMGLAQKQNAFMSLIESEISAAKDQYIAGLRMQVRGDIAEAIQKGELSIPGMVGSDMESKVIAEVTKKEIETIKADLARSPEESSFSVSYNGHTRRLTCSYTVRGGPQNRPQSYDANRQLDADPQLRDKVRKAVLGAFGIPG